MSEIEELRAMLRQVVRRGEEPAPVEQIRAMYDAWGMTYPLPDGAVEEAVSLGGVAALKITPPGARADAAMLYLHGGGYVIGSSKSHRHLAGHLGAAAGLPAYALDYRLAPEHPFPAALDDAVGAYAALLAQGVSPKRIIIAGDSAGGGLTVATALVINAKSMPQPGGLFCISPWADLGQKGASYNAVGDKDLIVDKTSLDRWAALYLVGRPSDFPLASPIYGEFDGVAPMLIHVGSDEVLLSDAVRLTEAAGLARVPVTLSVAPDMPHVWHFMITQLTMARQAIAAAGQWMKLHVAP